MEKLRSSPVHSNFKSGTYRMGSVDVCKSSSLDNVIFLHDWYLIKSPKVHLGKRLAVGGLLSKGNQGAEIFHSAPIIQRINAFRLRTADGFTILLGGLIDGQRTCENGFPSKVSSLFQIGFPFTWEVLADMYISKDVAFSSSLGREIDVDEFQHSTGRAIRVKKNSDDEKSTKIDSVSKPENDRSMQYCSARKFDDRVDSFLRDPALCMGSHAKDLKSSDGWKSKEKGFISKNEISPSGSALGSILELNDDGRMHLDDGDIYVQTDSNEAILNQRFSDTVKSGLMGSTNKDRCIQSDSGYGCVNGNVEKKQANKHYKKKATGNSYSVDSVSVDDCVRMAANPVDDPGSQENAYAPSIDQEKDGDNLPKPLECTSDMSCGNAPVNKNGDENDNDLTMEKVSNSEIMHISESGIIMPMGASFECTPARSVISPVVLRGERFPCKLGKDTSTNANNGVFVGNSIGARDRDASKLIIGDCKTRSNSRNVNQEHVEPENDNLIKNPTKRNYKCQLGVAEMKTRTTTSTRKDASSVDPSNQRVTRSWAKSSSYGSLQKEGQKGSPRLKDGHNKGISVSIGCPKNAALNMDGSMLAASEFGLREMKDKMRLDANLFDSAFRNTRSKALSCLESSQKQRQKDCSGLKDASNGDVTVSENCSKEAVLDICGGKLGASELGVRDIKIQESVDAKTFDSDKLLNISNSVSCRTARCKLQYGRNTDLRIQHTGKHLLSAVGCDHIQDLITQRLMLSDDVKEVSHSCSEADARNKTKGKKHVQHLYRPSSKSTKRTSSDPGEAFSLKMSRSGRLIVPPLAHWRNEKIVYDLEGSIACIFDGSQVIKRPGTHSLNLPTRSNKQQRRS